MKKMFAVVVLVVLVAAVFFMDAIGEPYYNTTEDWYYNDCVHTGSLLETESLCIAYIYVENDCIGLEVGVPVYEDGEVVRVVVGLNVVGLKENESIFKYSGTTTEETILPLREDFNVLMNERARGWE